MPLQGDNLSTQTTTADASVQELIAIPCVVGATVALDIVVIGTDDTGNALIQGITALYVNIAGVITLVGSAKQKGITNSTSKNWNVNAAVDQPGQGVNITVQGTVSASIRWAVDGMYETLLLGA